MPCNPIDFQIPSYEEYNNDDSSINHFPLLEEHENVTVIFRKIRGNYFDHPAFIQAEENIIKSGFSITDDITKFSQLSIKTSNSKNKEEQVKLIEEIEKALCVKRQELFILIGSLPDRGEPWRHAIPAEIKKHLEHREQDRKQWLSWLESQMKKMESSAEKVDIIEMEMERVRGLTENQLLSNREIFGRNASDFE